MDGVVLMIPTRSMMMPLVRALDDDDDDVEGDVTRLNLATMMQILRMRADAYEETAYANKLDDADDADDTDDADDDADDDDDDNEDDDLTLSDADDDDADPREDVLRRCR
jgi:hypothetical protein